VGPTCHTSSSSSSHRHLLPLDARRSRLASRRELRPAALDLPLPPPTFTVASSSSSATAALTDQETERIERGEGGTGGRREVDGEEKAEWSRSVPLKGIFRRVPLCSRRSPSKHPRERIRSALIPRFSNQTHGYSRK
jgi:hypothetical protein